MPQSGLSERELLTDLMNQEKQLLGAYTTVLQEAVCPNLRKLLLNHFHQASMDQYELQDQMRQKGYHAKREAPGEELRQAMASLKSIQSEIL